MDEYTASYLRMEKLICAAQSIKECLLCTICLGLFKEPVTIKCGHKFCRSCILHVAKNEQATCPVCKIKIQKRSIPKASNELLQLCVERFNALIEAITADSGIDVLQQCPKVKHTKESVSLDERSRANRIEESSTTSKGSSSITNQKSRVNSQNNKRLSLRKKLLNSETKTINNKKNTLGRYLSGESEYVPPEEKVSNWLKSVSQNVDDAVNTDFDHENALSAINTPKEDLTIKKSAVTQLKESDENSVPKTFPSTNKLEESKINYIDDTSQKAKEPNQKEILNRTEEEEMIGRKKKLNQSLLDKHINTPSSVPAASLSDGCDWRRVRRVGKEMQVHTFKPLHVSVEKSSSSIVLDDTVPCNSTNNDSKSVSRESDTNKYLSNNVPALETKQIKSSKNRSIQQKDTPKKTIQDYSYKHHSLDSSSGSHREENNSLLCIDPKRVNEIIGILPARDILNTPERTRNTSKISNQESKLNHLSPLKTKTNNDHQENELSGDESSRIDCKTVTNLQNSPSSKHKLSLKMKLKCTINSKSFRSQPSTLDKIGQIENESQRNFSPDRPKSKLSLRLSNTKSSERFVSQTKIPIQNRFNNSKLFETSNRPLISFRKLGKICKKRKNVPFFQFGKMVPKIRVNISPNKQQMSGIIIKSDVVANVNYKSLITDTNVTAVYNNTSSKVSPLQKEVKMLSPEKDSQLKFLSIESPHCVHDISEKMNDSENENKSNKSKLNQSNEIMEIDTSLPKTDIISKCQLDFWEEISENNKNIDEKLEDFQPEPSTSICEKIIGEITETNTNSSKSSLQMMNTSNLPVNYEVESSTNGEECKVDNGSRISISDENPSPVKTKVNKMEEDLISISSSEGETKNSKSHSSSKTVVSENSKIKNKSSSSEVESNTDSELINESKDVNSKKKKSIFTSRSTSPLKKLPLKKKRARSESSNDDDVSSIIRKWCDATEEPVIKRSKTISNIQEDFASDDKDVTLLNDGFKQSQIEKLQSDPPIDDIINKVKSFKDNDANSSKLAGMTSSLMSTDLFDTNEQCVQPNAQVPSKQVNEIASDKSLISTFSPSRKSCKENLSSSQNLTDVTMMDLIQFNKKKSNGSESSDGSDKENNVHNQDHTSTPKRHVENVDQGNEMESCQNERATVKKNHSVNEQFDSYQVPDSLINITQEQLALKKIEKALIGVDLSELHNDRNEKLNDTNKYSTPRKKSKHSQIVDSIIDDFDSDNIDATPIAKRKQILNFSSSKLESNVESNKSDLFSPDRKLNLIPAVTPVKNTKSYPLCHSTPMINTPDTTNKSNTQIRKITLICSGLKPENTTVVHSFVKKFNANFQNNFNIDVTHVIVQTHPLTKAGQKTYKYIQGIAFKKFVVSYQWIVDCIKQNSLLNEDEEKYEVLDPDILESGSKRSRLRTQDIFEGYAFLCKEPFSSFSLSEFKNLLKFNGAVITNTAKELSIQRDKYKIVILESEDLSEGEISALKKSKGVLVSFEWIVDSISQYYILSLLQYMYETTVEEALALGFPPELLADEETGEYDEESE